MPIEELASLHSMAGTKSIPRPMVQRVGKIVRRIIDECGNQTAASKVTHISQPQLSDLANEKAEKGVGLPVLLKLRTYLGVSVDEILGLPPLPQRNLLLQGANDLPPMLVHAIAERVAKQLQSERGPEHETPKPTSRIQRRRGQ